MEEPNKRRSSGDKGGYIFWRQDCFKERGYGENIINKAYLKAKNTDRNILLAPKKKEQKTSFDNKISFITRYCIDFTSPVEFEGFLTLKIRPYVNLPPNCCSKGIVYLITCTKCNEQYVGCTTRSLKERAREHINQVSNIQHSSKTNVTRHFMECNNSNLKYFSIQGIEQIKTSVRGGDFVTKLRRRECTGYFIYKLGCHLDSIFNLT
ncbi:hypothetical protein XELAEV_18011348mg [Xenopus laevis]|uniref:GIY-YIG domain-containing protein n=1 Tax=Xenopus laevis TaxID=8355 RepID=A0A974DKQ8_XENLA|nr:hypothetical protein XELAEV_18011348mg [Xenopus laevis]